MLSKTGATTTQQSCTLEARYMHICHYCLKRAGMADMQEACNKGMQDELPLDQQIWVGLAIDAAIAAEVHWAFRSER